MAGVTVLRLEARHPIRPNFGLDVHPDNSMGSCRRQFPEAQLLCANFHILMLCEQGTDSRTVQFDEFCDRPGSLLWIPPGVVHERVPPFSGWDVCFTSAFIGSEMSDGPVGGAWSLEGRVLSAVQALCSVLATEYFRYLQAPTGLRSAQDEVLLQHLLIALIKRVQAEPRMVSTGQASNPIVSSFLRMVEDKCSETLTVETYARQLGCSPRTLSRVCYDQLGLTPGQLINRHIVKTAESMLTTTDLPVAAIARAVGFSDCANFTRFFKRETGSTPGVYRKCQRPVEATLRSAAHPVGPAPP